MERKYLMIDSTYRDRFLYPNPAEFVLPINNSIGNNAFDSKNPIATGYPITNFCFLSDDGNTFKGKIVGGNPSAIQVEDNINLLTGIDVPNVSTTLEEANDMFINLSLKVENDDNTYRIISYDPVRLIIYLDSPLLGFSIGAEYTILNYSTPQSIVLQGYKLSFIGFPTNDDGFFITSSKLVYVWDLTINEVRSGYLNNYSIVLTTPFSASWDVNDKYIISLDTPPTEMGVYSQPLLKTGLLRFQIIHNGCSLYQNQTEVQFVAPNDTRPVSSIAIGRVIFTHTNRGVSRVDILYCGDEYIVNGQYYLVPVGHTMDEYDVCDLCVVRVTNTAVGFIVENPPQTNSLTGMYFMPLLLTSAYTYDSATNNVQVSPNKSLPFIPDRVMKHNSTTEGNSLNGMTPIIDVLIYKNMKIILTQPFESKLYNRLNASNLSDFPEALNYYIFPYSRDGCVSLDYRGTMVSSNQMVCYAITVNTLILPNQILNLPFGSLTSSYPYVLLEITNETASSGHNKAVLYSNNPHTVSSTFVCSISDVNSPVITKFININSDKSTQTIKFKPNDNLKFRISMPDGRTFSTELNDYIPPLPPNGLLQINCLLEIVRL